MVPTELLAEIVTFLTLAHRGLGHLEALSTEGSIICADKETRRVEITHYRGCAKQVFWEFFL